VIIAEEVEGEALATLVVNKLRGIFNVLAVKAPGFGDRRKEMLEDISIVTGAEFISEDLGKKMEKVEISDLGQAHRVVSDKDKTTIVAGKGDKQKIDDRINQLRNQIKSSDSEFDKEKLQERLGKLSGGVAVIKVGAPIETAQKELKQRVEDAVAATRAAMEEGIVPGGGIALFNAVPSITPDKMEGNAFLSSSVRTATFSILSRALKSPVSAIIQNSGEKVDNIIEKLEANWQKENSWIGFNAMTNDIADLKEAGIIDPLKVVKTAFINAVSVAANYLTVGAAITDLPKKDEKGMPGGMPSGMGEDY